MSISALSNPGPPLPSSLPWKPNVLSRIFPHSEKEPHAAGSEHGPFHENQQLCRGPGPGRGDSAGAHHPCVAVSVRSPGGDELGGRGARCRARAQVSSLSAHRSLPALSNLGPPTTRGWPQCPGTRRGGERGHFPPSLGTRSSCFDLWKTRLIIFHLFSCFERLRRLFFSPLAPSPAPQKRDDFVFRISPVEPWPKPRGRCRLLSASCRCCPQGLLQVEEMADFPRLPVGLPPRHSWPGTHARPPPPSRYRQANPWGPAMV